MPTAGSIETPWGEVGELRSRRLRPGPGQERAAVDRHQRERIFAAIVTAVSQRGYATSRVADVIELAGVSRSTYYAHFDSLYDGVCATIEAILERTEATVAGALEGDAPWDDRLRRYFAAIVDLIVAQPAAARLCLVESYVAGPEAVEHLDRMSRAGGRRALAVVAESPERADMPYGVNLAVLGGLRTVIQTRLHAGREHELAELAPALMDWALGYRTPPAALRAARRPRRVTTRPTVGAEPRQRIIGALIEIVADKGYAGTTIGETAGLASVSLTTFYKQFDGKEEAFLAALDDVMLRLLEVALPAYREAEDWAHGVRQAIEAILVRLSHEPTMARFVAEAVWAGGPAAIERVGEGMAAFQGLLTEGLRRRPTPPAITAEAIGASMLALCFETVRRGRAERLYELTAPASFVALAPAIGSIEACTVANGG